MDLSHKYSSFTPLDPWSLTESALATNALDPTLMRELLASPNVPREVLASTLQESLRRFDSLLSCVSGTFYRCELTVEPTMVFVIPMPWSAICGWR